MPFVPAVGTVRVALTFENNGGNQAVNVIHVKTNDPPVTGLTLTTISSVVENWMETAWAGIAPTSWRAVRIECLDLSQEDGIFNTQAVDIAGLDTVDALPSTVSIAISLRTPFSGRSRRGRLYHVGMSDSRVAGDYITESAETSYINAYGQLRSDLIAEDLAWVVLSYVQDGAPRVTPLATAITDIVIVDRKVDKQSRRKPE